MNELAELLQHWRDTISLGKAMSADKCSDVVLEAINRCADQLEKIITKEGNPE